MWFLDWSIQGRHFAKKVCIYWFGPTMPWGGPNLPKFEYSKTYKLILFIHCSLGVQDDQKF